MRALALLFTLLAIPAQAEDALSAGQFDAYTQGKTLTYGVGGEAYGTEQYLPGHRVVWAFNGDDCREGSWYEATNQICFVYDDTPDAPQCWTFYSSPGGLKARFQDDPEGTELIEVEQSSAPMFCPGPEIGV